MDAVTLLLLLPLYTESCTPKFEALTSAAVSVVPHRLVELPQVSTASDVPKYGSPVELVWSVPTATPAFTSLITDIWRVLLTDAFRSTPTTTPRICALAGTPAVKLVMVSVLLVPLEPMLYVA